MEKGYKEWEEFEELAGKLIEFLRKHHHPHTQIIIDYDHAKVVEALYGRGYSIGD